MSLARFLRMVVEILEDSGVPYMLTGSLASAYYATPRATQDVDLVIDTNPDALERVVVGLGEAGFYVDRGAARAALESKGQFNAIDPGGGWKADLIIRLDMSYVERWVLDLGLSDEWRAARARADLRSGQDGAS